MGLKVSGFRRRHVQTFASDSAQDLSDPGSSNQRCEDVAIGAKSAYLLACFGCGSHYFVDPGMIPFSRATKVHHGVAEPQNHKNAPKQEEKSARKRL